MQAVRDPPGEHFLNFLVVANALPTQLELRFKSCTDWGVPPGDCGTNTIPEDRTLAGKPLAVVEDWGNVAILIGCRVIFRARQQTPLNRLISDQIPRPSRFRRHGTFIVPIDPSGDGKN